MNAPGTPGAQLAQPVLLNLFRVIFPVLFILSIVQAREGSMNPRLSNSVRLLALIKNVMVVRARDGLLSDTFHYSISQTQKPSKK